MRCGFSTDKIKPILIYENIEKGDLRADIIFCKYLGGNRLGGGGMTAYGGTDHRKIAESLTALFDYLTEKKPGGTTALVLARWHRPGQLMDRLAHARNGDDVAMALRDHSNAAQHHELPYVLAFVGVRLLPHFEKMAKMQGNAAEQARLAAIRGGIAAWGGFKMRSRDIYDDRNSLTDEIDAYIRTARRVAGLRGPAP